MNRNCGVQHEELIDFVEGEVSAERAVAIEAHLRACPSCASYVESLRRTFSLLGQDTVPEPVPAYWAYLAQSVRQRAGSRHRRRWFLVLAPTAAAVLVAVALIWRGPWVSAPEIDNVDRMLAALTTDELVETVAGVEAYDGAFLQAAGDDISALYEYLTETEDIYDLIETLSDTEAEALVSEVNSRMRPDEGTSKVITDLAGKEC